MTTQLGKELKKLRIDMGVTLAGLSIILKLSPAFLSAIETGRKRVPDNFLELLASKISQVESDKARYEALINQARNEVKLNLDNQNLNDTMLATALARRFNTLTSKQKEQLKLILKE